MQSAKKNVMMRTVLVLVVGIYAAAHGMLHAATIHTPVLCERGPLRYLFDFDEPQSSQHLKLWSAGYSRYAASAYTDSVGTKTDELSRLFFNEANFKLTEAFPSCLVSQNSEFYNPLIRTVHLHTKADYREKAVVFGARYIVPVYKDVGRMGVRVSIPIKAVEVRRLDVDGVPRGAELEEVLAVSQQIVPPKTGPVSTSDPFHMIRMDFAEALVQSRKNNPALTLLDTNDYPKIGGAKISDADLNGGDSALRNSIQRCVGVVRSPAGFIPRAPEVKNTAIVTSAPASGSTADLATADGTDAVLPADGNAEYKLLYRLETVGNPGKYSVLADETTNDIDERRARQRLKEELWLIPRVYSGHEEVSGFGEGGVIKTLVDLSEQVTENAYEWMKDRGYALESASYAGFGDCVVDFVYEHALGDKCYGEMFLGVSIPTTQKETATRQAPYASPYHVYLGTSNHWEVRLGGSLAGQPMSRLNVKADCYYSFVLPHEEMRHASFRGSRVKGVGPLVPVFVNWNYCVGRVEATVFHFKARAISNMVGYECFYKTRDALEYPSNNMATWLGRSFASDGTITRNEFPLDASVATQNTDAIAHRCKFETSFRVTSQCEFSLGFGYTFAGKNAPQAVDASFALNVSF